MQKISLRILIVLPMYGGSLPIGEYCAKALASLGHQTRVFDASKLYPAFTGLKALDISPERLNGLRNGYLRLVSQAAWTMAQEQKAQLVLAMAQAPLDKSTLERMRNAGMRTVMWFVEDYKIFDYWQIFAPLYDAFAVIQKEPFLKELANIGQKHAFYLPLAALPSFHKKISLSPQQQKEFGADISFLGAGYPNRRKAFRPLANKNFKIWGSDWEGESLLAKNIQRNGARIDFQESPQIYSGAKINLNLHSSIGVDSIVSEGDFVNPRTFELACMGLFQLVDKRELLPELFAENELATFSNLSDFYEKIEYFLKHPEKREEYARLALKRVLSEHTYEARMKKLVDYMLANFENLRTGALSEPAHALDLPEEIKRELKSLCKKLGLAPDAGFEDIVAKIRSQSGELSDVECALLFLDEWKKQYQ